MSFENIIPSIAVFNFCSMILLWLDYFVVFLSYWTPVTSVSVKLLSVPAPSHLNKSSFIYATGNGEDKQVEDHIATKLKHRGQGMMANSYNPST